MIAPIYFYLAIIFFIFVVWIVIKFGRIEVFPGSTASQMAQLKDKIDEQQRMLEEIKRELEELKKKD